MNNAITFIAATVPLRLKVSLHRIQENPGIRYPTAGHLIIETDKKCHKNIYLGLLGKVKVHRQYRCTKV